MSYATASFHQNARPLDVRGGIGKTWQGRCLVGITIALLCVQRVGGQPAAQGRPNPNATPGAAAREVFKDQAFWWKRVQSVEMPEATPSWLAAQWKWIGNVLRAVGDFIGDTVQRILEFFASISGFRLGDWSSGVPLLWLVIAVLVVLSLWKLYPWLRGLWIASAQRAEPARVHEEQLAEPRVLLAQAEAALRAGQEREALRLAFLALIAWLQQRRLLRYDASRTNREYYRDLRGDAKMAELFHQAVQPFERVWYGEMPVRRSDAELVLSLCHRAMPREEP